MARKQSNSTKKAPRKPRPKKVAKRRVYSKKSQGSEAVLPAEEASSTLSIRDVEVVGVEKSNIENDQPVALLPERSQSTTSSRDVVPYSPLTAYLREMRRYPRLTREEEKELAIRYREQDDVDAAYRLVSSNLWLVVKIARVMNYESLS